MSTKSQSLLYKVDYHGVHTRISGASIPFGGTISRTCTNTRTVGPNYADWKARIARGKQTTTTLSGTLFKFKPERFFCSASQPYLGAGQPPDTWIGGGYMEGYPPFVPPSGVDSQVDSSFADNLAKARFVKEAKSHIRSFQGGVFLGELREAIQMVRNPARSFRRGLDNYLSALKKKRPMVKGTKAQKELTAKKIVADTWLEYSFGWTPLLRDIDDGMKTLAQHHYGDDNPRSIMIRGRGKSVKRFSYSAGTFGRVGMQVAIPVSRTNTYQVVYYGKIWVQHPSKITPRRIGISLEDVAPTVYELLPWSFLVDYFTNVGDIIEAATFLQTNLNWVSRTIHQSTFDKVHSLSPAFTAWNLKTLHGGRSEAYVSSVSRAPYVGSLVPSFQVELPGFKNQWINLGALFANARKSRLL